MRLTAPKNQVDELIGLLRQQRDLYDQLDRLSRRQARFVAEGDAAGLLDLLERRQRLIDRLMHLHGRVEPFHREWPELCSEVDAQRRSDVKRLIGELERLVRIILERDHHDRAALGGPPVAPSR